MHGFYPRFAALQITPFMLKLVVIFIHCLFFLLDGVAMALAKMSYFVAIWNIVKSRDNHWSGSRLQGKALVRTSGRVDFGLDECNEWANVSGRQANFCQCIVGHYPYSFEILFFKFLCGKITDSSVSYLNGSQNPATNFTCISTENIGTSRFWFRRSSFYRLLVSW